MYPNPSPTLRPSYYVSPIHAPLFPSPLFAPGSPIPQSTLAPLPPPLKNSADQIQTRSNILPMVQISSGSAPDLDPNPNPNSSSIREPIETPIDDRRKRIGHGCGGLSDGGSGSDEGEAAKRRKKRGDKVTTLVNNPGQSKLLRELGVRVSRYTHEERRDIILKYMQKRSGRQVVNRTAKIPSRQALAERRLRGVGGKFLSKEEIQVQTSQKEDKNTTKEPQQNETEESEEPELPEEAIAEAIASGIPLVGMVFESEEKAYEYYITYASNIGFTVRKGWWDKNKTSKNTPRSRVFVCSREGFKPKNKNELKRVRPETRTNCEARMGIKIDSRGKYRVYDFVSDHNHPLSTPLDLEMLNSQKGLNKPEHKLENAASLIPVEYMNYIRAKRLRSTVKGDSEALLEYFRRMKNEDPLFYYAVQVDEYDQLTNFFWANSKNIMDYRYFNDVVCLDTTFRVLDFGQPLALFLGQNHHRQILIFGSALLYDDSSESLKWLFETFNACMGGKIPNTVLTDRYENINQIVSNVWTGTIHRFCTYHIYLAAIKELGYLNGVSENISRDLERCLFHSEEEEEFITTWDSMLERENLKDNKWLCKLFEEREKWAVPYNRNVYTADIENSLKDENLCDLIKGPLEPNKSFSSFLDFYEIFLKERRQKEEQADYEFNHNTLRVPPIQILWQAASIYTPAVLRKFRDEFEKTIDCIAYTCDEFGSLADYMVTLKGISKEYIVRFNSSDNTALCTCKKFERIGMICCHVLKVYELRNLKEIPGSLILNRWRKDAKMRGGSNNENSENNNRDQSISIYQMLYKIALKASENDDIFSLVMNQSGHMLAQIEKIFQENVTEKHNIGNFTKEERNNLAPNENFIAGRNVGETGKGRRKRNQTELLEVNKRLKGKKDPRQSGELEQSQYQPREDEMCIIPPSHSQNASTSNNLLFNPNHLMQGQFLLEPRFGVGAAQTINSISQFGQGSSFSSLHQPHLPSSNHMSQGYTAADMQALQYVGSNPQSTNQPHGSVPVWDFL